MPLTVQEATFLGAGMLFAGGATFFYKRKQTLPFKIAYFLSWPTLGTGVILALQPNDKKLLQQMKAEGLVTEDQMEDARRKTQLQLDAIREAAKKD